MKKCICQRKKEARRFYVYASGEALGQLCICS